MALIKLVGNKIHLRVNASEGEATRGFTGGNWNRKTQSHEFPSVLLPDIVSTFGEDCIGDKATRDEWERLTRLEERAERIKSGDESVLPPAGRLMLHQRKCLALSRLFKRYALFLDTGTGKTVASLAIIADNPNTKWLIVVPKNIIRTAWIADADEFYPHLRVLPLSKNFGKEYYVSLAKQWGCLPSYNVALDTLRDGMATLADVLVINPESFKLEIPRLQDLGVSGLILDESSVIKNPRSDTSKAVTLFARKMERVYILSGKPAPNNMLEYYPQMDVVERGLLGLSFWQFREAYFEPHGFKGYQWRPKRNALDLIGAKVSRRAYFVSKEDCLDLPEKTYLVNEVDLPPKALRYYRSMERERVLELANKTVIAPNLLTSLMKLRQITSGFVLDDDTAEILHTAKLAALMATLEDIGDKPVIIWCNFQKEIRMIEEALQGLGMSVVTAYGETKNVDDSIEAFKNGSAQYIVAHPATLKYGVTFTHCTYAIYYSLSYSFENYYQSHDRIYRKGQTQPCTFIFLLCPDTIDYMIYHVLQEKGDLAKAVEDYVKAYGKQKGDS